MDPVGNQGKISVPKDRSSGAKGSKNIHKELLDEVEPSSTNWGGGFNKRSGTRPADNPKLEDRWQGTVRGGTKHTYGVDGQNDAD